MTDDFSWVVDTIEGLVRGGRAPEEAARHLVIAMPQEIVDRALLEFLKRAGKVRTLKDPAGLDGDLPSPWYAGPNYDVDRFWPALQDLLAEDLLEGDIESIDRSSTKVVSRLPCPGGDQFSGRGLVLGYVQSGKTANFSAVLAKAADAGYRLVIVLSGITNSLREQTQERLTGELVEPHPAVWISLTSDGQDFRIGKVTTASSLLTTGQPLFAVVKKNATVLRRLNKWLRAAPPEIRAKCPAIVIDDEADQASVNTGSGETDRPAVNSQVLELLDLLPRVAYVGYTATPFANVFIDPTVPRDLYPRDFIIDLPRPPSYFGAERIFGRDRLLQDEADEMVDGLDIVRRVEDDEVDLVKPKGRAAEGFQPVLPPSLLEAIDYFVLASAARAARGHRDHHTSMLIHTTLSSKVHMRTRPLVEAHVAGLLAGVRASDGDLLSRLTDIWDRETAAVPAVSQGESETNFSSLAPYLELVLDGCDVVVENSISDLRLKYDGPKRVHIVIGGNVLSRGLTIRGLVVSYFVRTASTYDTLLQMGRWFGYRTNYTDLPRVWMTQDLADSFRDLALVEKELRLDLRRYELEGVTPLDFAPKIRTHPKLMITSAQKMGKAVARDVSYSSRFVQTTFLHHRDEGIIERNQRALRDLVDHNGPTRAWRPVAGRWVRTGIPVEHISEFLAQFVIHPNNVEANATLIRDYIRAQVAEGSLTEWTVAVVGREAGGRPMPVGLGLSVGLLKRSRLPRADASSAYLGVITSDSDLSCDLQDGISRWKSDEPEVIRARDAAGPLLLLYVFDKDAKPLVAGDGRARRLPLEAARDLVGAAFVFPASRTPTPQAYMTVDLSGVDREELEPPLPEEEEE